MQVSAGVGTAGAGIPVLVGAIQVFMAIVGTEDIITDTTITILAIIEVEEAILEIQLPEHHLEDVLT